MNLRPIFLRGQIQSWYKSLQSYSAHHCVYTSSGLTLILTEKTQTLALIACDTRELSAAEAQLFSNTSFHRSLKKRVKGLKFQLKMSIS